MKLLIPLVAIFALQEGDVPRIPEPDAEAQKTALKGLKDVFKDEYAKKSPADQLNLARKLIQTCVEAGVDSATRYVCLAEARDLAVAAGDTPVAMEAVTLLGKSFMIAVPAARMAVLGKLAAAAKDPEKVRALAKGYTDLAKDGIAGEDYETATSAAAKAETLARAVKDASIAERVADLKKDIGSLKAEFQKVKAAGDADAAGRYLCFVRNDWPAGLKLLSEGGKPPLKELATKDLAAPEAVEAQVELGDGWWTQAQSEKISWKKQNLLAHARVWYDKALPGASGLVKVRLNKRLAEMEVAASTGGVSLLPMVDPKRDTVHGEWTLEDGVLVVNKGDNNLILQLPYQPPEEYDFQIGVKRVGSTDSVLIGFVVAGTQAVAMVDGYPTNNVWLSGFEMLDGKLLRDQTACFKGKQQVTGDKATTLIVQVRKSSVTLLVDGKKLIGFDGPMSKLANRADSGVPDTKALFVGGWNGRLGFTDLRVTPLSGPGKKTR